MAHGDSQGCLGHVQRPPLQLTVMVVRRKVGQLERPKSLDYIIGLDDIRLAGKDAVDQKTVYLNVRIRTTILNHI